MNLTTDYTDETDMGRLIQKAALSRNTEVSRPLSGRALHLLPMPARRSARATLYQSQSCLYHRRLSAVSTASFRSKERGKRSLRPWNFWRKIEEEVRQKRQRAGALQDALRISGIIVPRAASWTAAALRRFSHGRVKLCLCYLKLALRHAALRRHLSLVAG